MLLDSQLDPDEILAVYLLWELLSIVPSVANEQQDHLGGLLHFFMPAKCLFDQRLTDESSNYQIFQRFCSIYLSIYLSIFRLSKSCNLHPFYLNLSIYLPIHSSIYLTKLLLCVFLNLK